MVWGKRDAKTDQLEGAKVGSFCGFLEFGTSSDLSSDTGVSSCSLVALYVWGSSVISSSVLHLQNTRIVPEVWLKPLVLNARDDMCNNFYISEKLSKTCAFIY